MGMHNSFIEGVEANSTPSEFRKDSTNTNLDEEDTFLLNTIDDILLQELNEDSCPSLDEFDEQLINISQNEGTETNITLNHDLISKELHEDASELDKKTP